MCFITGGYYTFADLLLWSVDNASVGNSTIFTVTMIENAEDLELLAKADNDSVGDGGSSDVEGDGEFERTLLKEDAQQAFIERRDHDRQVFNPGQVRDSGTRPRNVRT